MTKREEFKKLVLEALHGLSYEEAVMQDAGLSMKFITKKIPVMCHGCYCQSAYMREGKEVCKCGYSRDIPVMPITIGRVMQAFYNKNSRSKNIHLPDLIIKPAYDDNECKLIVGNDILIWKLTKAGRELIDSDQSSVVINHLIMQLNDE